MKVNVAQVVVQAAVAEGEVHSVAAWMVAAACGVMPEDWVNPVEVLPAFATGEVPLFDVLLSCRLPFMGEEGVRPSNAHEVPGVANLGSALAQSAPESAIGEFKVVVFVPGLR